VPVGTYEIVAVLRPDLDDEALSAALDRVGQRIADQGGRVASVERWGKRRLAYPIQKHRDGYYALLVFTLDAGRIAPLRQVLGLNEEMLRFSLAAHRAKPAPLAAGASAAAAAPGAPAPGPGSPASTSAPAPAGSPGTPGAVGSTDGQGPGTPRPPHV
jgi:small subunit ribosomal protein S6